MQQMTSRIVFLAGCLFILPILPVTAAASPLQSDEKKEEEKSFQVTGGWLNKRTPLKGQRFWGHSLRRVEPHPAGAENSPEAEIEEETIQVGTDTERKVTRFYRRDGSGRRRLVKVVEESRTVRKDGGEEAVRSVSHPDVNGRMQLQVKESQTVTVKGENEFQVQTVVSMPDGRSRLRPVEQLVQTERRQADGTVELDRTYYVVDGNRQWTASERRVAVSHPVGEERRTEEEVFRADANKRLLLSDRITSREWQAGDSGRQRTMETWSVNAEGKLQLSERLHARQDTGADGMVRIVQDVERRNEGNGRMELFERVTSTSSSEGPSDKFKEIRVEAPDGSGRLTTVRAYQETNSGDPDSKKNSRTVRGQ